MAGYASVQELREQIEKTGTEDDDVIAAIIEAASQCIDRFCNRPDGFVADTVASARIYSGSGLPVQWIDECVAVALVEVKDDPTDDTYTAWAATDWIAASGDPRRPDFNRTPYLFLVTAADGDYDYFTGGRMIYKAGFRPLEPRYEQHGVPTVRVTAKWGYSAVVPTVIKQACITMASRWYKKAQGAHGDTLASPELGQLIYRKVLDPDVEMILVNGRFVRPPV